MEKIKEAAESPIEISTDAIDNHDSIGEPRDSEEVKNLVDAIEDDTDFHI